MSEERNEKHFERWTDKPAKVHLPVVGYQWSNVPPRTVDPSKQRYWYDVPELCYKRDLNQMSVHERANINGHIVVRHAQTARKPYTVDGVQCSFDEALALVCQEAA